MPILAVLLTAAASLLAVSAVAETLRPPVEFRSIAPAAARAAALFDEAAKVFTHARCVNCHPATARPLQTDASHPHRPRVVRGPKGDGVAGMRCQSCHTEANNPAGVPGAGHWKMPAEGMAFAGRSAGEICAQIKDSAQNGGRPTGSLIMHVAFDPLIVWAWSPGADRRPPPGTHQDFVALINAWLDAGAACPDP